MSGLPFLFEAEVISEYRASGEDDPLLGLQLGAKIEITRLYNDDYHWGRYPISGTDEKYVLVNNISPIRKNQEGSRGEGILLANALMHTTVHWYTVQKTYHLGFVHTDEVFHWMSI